MDTADLPIGSAAGESAWLGEGLLGGLKEE
jgi:hypothetical protein